jgi:hypothetical protein
MTTRSLARSGRQVALPIHVHTTSVAVVDPKIRATVVTVLARLLLEAASTGGRSEGARDEP